ncbi:MAG: hypothetical protein L3J13_05640, partial [Devosiaceae bacterium]|nr:hypothetical protein [Devosiaceae bacterium]
KLVANADLITLRRQAAMPINVRITTTSKESDRVAGEMGGTRKNGQVVELTCLQNEKMATLARLTALGSIISDVEISPPSLEELYRKISSSELEMK